MLIGLLTGLAVASAATATVIQHEGIRVSLDGSLEPRRLPRSSPAPVTVGVSVKVSTVDPGRPAELRSISIAINRYGHFEPSGLPVCTVSEIQPATTQNALKACRGALIGRGSFRAKVVLHGQAPFPSSGVMYAFNGIFHGRPAILAHVFGTDPVPTSFTLPFTLEQTKGTFGSVLRASLPVATGNSSYVTSLSLNLGKRFRSHGRMHSYLSASCPAPRGFRAATFPLVKATFGFAGDRSLTSVLTRSCRVRG